MTQGMMNNFWRTLAVLSAFIGAVHCLTCRSCPVGLLGTCLVSDDVTCNNATEKCFTGEAQFNATQILTLHTRGCLDSDLCGRTLTGTLLGVAYTASFQCCNTTLCNGASSVHISLTVALSAALLSALWGTWEL
ncbi:hypothetical protein INR49_027449 [Caranx melampygus]|nr:hypothetical protein INR49_027449 [Caranx melampygus]